MAANRTEVSKSYPLANGRLVTIILRDKISIDDIVTNRTKAKLLALRAGEAEDTVRVNRKVKDLLIKSNIEG